MAPSSRTRGLPVREAQPASVAVPSSDGLTVRGGTMDSIGIKK